MEEKSKHLVLIMLQAQGQPAKDSFVGVWKLKIMERLIEDCTALFEFVLSDFFILALLASCNGHLNQVFQPLTVEVNNIGLFRAFQRFL